MKHVETVLALAVGIVVGTALGYYVGSDSAVPSVSPTSLSPASARTINEAPLTSSSSKQRRPDHEWIATFQDDLKHASPGQPTPGIVDTIGEALRSDPPLDTARVLFLIQTMRKEDFPVALHLFKTVKDNINVAYVNANGPLAWTAFWQQFGAVDPENALANALQSGDLTYTGRDLLEKHLFTGLARNNADAAARTFLALPELSNRASAAEGLVFEWAKTNPAAAVAWAQQNLSADVLDRASYAAVWGASDVLDISGGNTLLKTIPGGEMRTSAVRSMKHQVMSKPDLPAAQIIEFMTITRTLRVEVRCCERV
jgi:hypothetical protein